MMTKWRVWPERKKSEHYFDVCLFQTKAQMRAFLESHRTDMPRGYFGDAQGFCESYERRSRIGRRWRREPRCGAVYFHLGCMGVGIVSHEMTHAAQWFLQWRYDWKPDRCVKLGKRRHNDELLANTVMALSKGYWRGFYKRVKTVPQRRVA